MFVEGDDELLLHCLTEPRRIDRDDVVFRNPHAGVLDQPLVKQRQFAQVEILTRSHVVAEVRPHVAHRNESNCRR